MWRCMCRQCSCLFCLTTVAEVLYTKNKGYILCMKPATELLCLFVSSQASQSCSPYTLHLRKHTCILKFVALYWQSCFKQYIFAHPWGLLFTILYTSQLCCSLRLTPHSICLVSRFGDSHSHMFVLTVKTCCFSIHRTHLWWQYIFPHRCSEKFHWHLVSHSGRLPLW